MICWLEICIGVGWLVGWLGKQARCTLVAGYDGTLGGGWERRNRE